MTNKTVILITGASSGIGRALAELYAAPNSVLLLTGRNRERLEDVAAACREKGAETETSTIPVTDQDGIAHQILAWDDVYKIDLVIANAGISGGSGGGGESNEQFRTIMATNVDGVLNTILPIIPHMTERNNGQIVLMGSMAGFRGLPTAPAYSVSKNAVRALAEGLRPALKIHNIKVNVICPGFIKTPLTDVNNFKMPFLMTPEAAAAKMKKGIEKNKPVIAFPWPIFLGIRFITYLPRFLADHILSKAPKKP